MAIIYSIYRDNDKINIDWRVIKKCMQHKTLTLKVECSST